MHIIHLHIWKDLFVVGFFASLPLTSFKNFKLNINCNLLSSRILFLYCSLPHFSFTKVFMFSFIPCTLPPLSPSGIVALLVVKWWKKAFLSCYIYIGYYSRLISWLLTSMNPKISNDVLKCKQFFCLSQENLNLLPENNVLW